LDDAIALALRQALQNAIGRCQGGDIDGWIGKLLFEGMVNHSAIRFVISYWHVFFSFNLQCSEAVS
jgi:hypothetical protein